MNTLRVFLMLTVLFAAVQLYAQEKAGIYLNKTNYPQLVIDGNPFLILGGELGNSSASDAAYMRSRWQHLKAMNVNTVLVPVYWELMEPEEGRFDFTLVDSMITAARQHQVKVVLLWFGSWKNSMSCYAPLWMKQDHRRFPRTFDSNARSQEIFSVFGKATLAADQKAFAGLMRHVKLIDEASRTVIMVQVENEIGMLPVAREFSTIADGFFNAAVPAELMNYLVANKANLVPGVTQRWETQGSRKQGSWAEVFGKNIYTDELFQAWYYAKYTNAVTLAGKKEYDIPMFVNAALPRPGKLPGQYPSAGPLPHLMNIWQAGAPSLDMLSPDFYNPDTEYWCDLYTRNGNVLFVPEMQFDHAAAAKAFLIIGHYHAIGFSPFSIESEDAKASVPLTKAYALLQQLSPFIANKKWIAMDGFVLDKKHKSTSVTMGRYHLRIMHDATLSWSPEAKDSVWSTTGGIILQTGPGEFLVAGTGLVVTFAHSDSTQVCNIASADEVSFINGAMQKGRRMNGDQDHQGRHIRFAVGEWGIQQVKLYDSPAHPD